MTDGVTKQANSTPVIFAPLKKIKKTVIIEKGTNENEKKKKRVI
jgi:hypothetical protein